MLSGIKVIEIGQVLSAPYAGAVFSDFGAEVIKIEKPSGGDDARQMGHPFRDGASMEFQDVNRGKRSVVIDLKSEAGRTQLFALLEHADILIHNLKPGVPAKLGIDGAALTARFPRLVYCEMSSFGHRGPRQFQPGYESLLQAFSGLINMTGERDGAPSRMGASLVDQGTSMWTVIGALVALHRRSQTGRGGVINTSLFETALFWGSHHIHAQVNEGRPSRRYGTGHPNLVPYQAFPTADGLLMIAVGNDRLFRKLTAAMGKPEWADDPRFATNPQRLTNRDTLVALVSEALATQPRAEWVRRFESVGVPAAPVNSIGDVINEEQFKAIDILRPLDNADYKLMGLPVSFDGVRPPAAGRAPKLGEHTEAYLGGTADTKKTAKS